MELDNKNFRKKYSIDGYFVCESFFSKGFISELIYEIENSKDTIKYYDKNKNLRRIEKLYDKGINLNKLNTEILKLLRKIFQKDFLIFKDKFNAKPPGGEGFFAHYDGIFHFKDHKNVKRNGWYEYGDCFVNVLIALDRCNEENGALQLAKAHKGNFNELLKNTKNDGTPALTKEVENNTIFNLINLNVGDVVVFSNTCPHRSKKNDTKYNRRVLYYTYSLSSLGSKYLEYFKDKEKSKNPSKALVDR
tara:strand:- start:9912 stop:10655 length:744 start_codon:yes stop_codon:yes gene_type:complete